MLTILDAETLIEFHSDHYVNTNTRSYIGQVIIIRRFDLWRPPQIQKFESELYLRNTI